MDNLPRIPLDTVTEAQVFEPVEGLLPNTDAERAVVFARHHRLEVLYLKDLNKWLRWDDRQERWTHACSADLHLMGMQTSLYMGQKANRDKNLDLAESAKKAQSRGGISSMVSLAASIECIQAMQTDFDNNPHVLNVRSGVIELKNSSFRLREPADRLMKIASVGFDPKATAPHWEAFMNDFCNGDQELVRYHQKIAGYCLTGLTNEQCLFLMYGQGSNGKSTYLQALKDILGDYAQTLPIETIIGNSKQGATSGLARMQGIRMVVANELNHGAKLDEALLKQLTGSEDITARFMFQEYTEFRPQAKIFLATNNLPAIQGIDLGIWRRIKVVPCLHTFRGDECDKDFSAKLQQETSGILNWCLEGCSMYLAEGLAEPHAVTKATEDYRNKAVGVIEAPFRFVSERCELLSDGKVGLKELYDDYRKWCDSAGEPCLTSRNLVDQLIAKHPLVKDRSMCDGATAIRGIRLKATNIVTNGQSPTNLLVVGKKRVA